MKIQLSFFLIFLSFIGFGQSNNLLMSGGKKIEIDNAIKLQGGIINARGSTAFNEAQFSGNKRGIGLRTSVPTAMLEISGTGYNPHQIFRLTNESNAHLLINSSNSLGWVGLRIDRNSSEKWFWGISGTNLNNDLLFRGSGFVGIGTPTPTARLHVVGTVTSSDSVVSTLGFKLNNNTVRRYFMANGSTTTIAPVPYIDTLYNSKRVLGFNTNSPTALFTVNGNGYASDKIFRVTSSSDLIGVINTTQSNGKIGLRLEKLQAEKWYIGLLNVNTEDLNLISNKSNLFLKASPGYLGLGNINPQSLFEVNRNNNDLATSDTITGLRNFVRFSNANNAFVRIISNTEPGNGKNTGIAFDRSGTQRWYFGIDSLIGTPYGNFNFKIVNPSYSGLVINTSSGRVGIGSLTANPTIQNPTPTLEVAGTVTGRGHIYNVVTTPPTATSYNIKPTDDYVIVDNYSSDEYSIYLPEITPSLAGKRYMIRLRAGKYIQELLFDTNWVSFDNTLPYMTIYRSDGTVFAENQGTNRLVAVNIFTNGTDWFLEGNPGYGRN